ncbi:unnamed protein product [Prunus armeniaca]
MGKAYQGKHVLCSRSRASMFMSYGKAHMITHYHAHDGVIVDHEENYGTWNMEPKTRREKSDYLLDDPKFSAPIVALSIVCTNNKCNCSTLGLQGNSKQLEPVKEVAVVSGTGKFATLEKYFLDNPIGYSVVKWNVTVQHY